MPKPAINAIVIPVQGAAEIGQVAQDIRTLQGIVGGYIEAISTMYDEEGRPQAILWCNEEGKLKDFALNRRATAIWYALNGGPTGDTLCGTIILTGANDGNGDILPVPEVLVDLWRDIHAAGD